MGVQQGRGVAPPRESRDMTTKVFVWFVAGLIAGFAVSELISVTGGRSGSDALVQTASPPAADAGSGDPRQQVGGGDSLGSSPVVSAAGAGPVVSKDADAARRAGAAGPPAGGPPEFHPLDVETQQRLVDEGFTTANEMAMVMAGADASQAAIEAMYEMARHLESLAGGAEMGVDSGQADGSSAPKELAFEAAESLVAAGAPDQMTRHVQETLLAPLAEPEPPLDPRDRHAD